SELVDCSAAAARSHPGRPGARAPLTRSQQNAAQRRERGGSDWSNTCDRSHAPCVQRPVKAAALALLCASLACSPLHRPGALAAPRTDFAGRPLLAEDQGPPGGPTAETDRDNLALVIGVATMVALVGLALYAFSNGASVDDPGWVPDARRRGR